MLPVRTAARTPQVACHAGFCNNRAAGVICKLPQARAVSTWANSSGERPGSLQIDCPPYKPGVPTTPLFIISTYGANACKLLAGLAELSKLP